MKRRSRRRERELDSYRGLLRKRQNEKKDYLNSGADETEVCAWYDPKIAALEKEIARLLAEDDDDEEQDQEVRYVKQRPYKKQRRR